MSTHDASHRARAKRPLVAMLVVTLLAMAAINLLVGFPSIKKALAEPTVDDPCGISGWVFNDRNADGVFQYAEEDPTFGVQGSEPGIGGVEIVLEKPNGTFVTSTTSFEGDFNTGWFRFQSLDPGVYRVIETDPDGWVSVSSNRQIVPLQVKCAAEVLFGDRRENSIAGVVFEDINGNRRQDQGEPGIAGVTITITPRGMDTPPFTLAPPNYTLTTDQYGAYEANGVTPGMYVVEETDPPGYVSLSPNRRNVNLKDGGFETANFADASVNNSITGVVFADNNGNSVQDPGDLGLSQWDVSIDTVSPAGGQGPHAVDATVKTNENGQYAVTDLAAGTYQVSPDVRAGFTTVSPAALSVTVVDNLVRQANFALADGDSVSGVVFLDQNGDGVQQWTELGLPNVELELRLGGSLVMTTGTLFDGSYQFDMLAPATYRVVEIDPAGLTSTTPNSVDVALVVGGAAFANFGDQAASSIGGIVFQDENGNGARDVNEPGIFGVRVALQNAQGGTIRTTTTVGTGAYLFENLSAGPFAVVQTDLPGFRSTTANKVPVTLVSGASTAANFGDELEIESLVYVPQLSSYRPATR